MNRKFWEWVCRAPEGESGAAAEVPAEAVVDPATPEPLVEQVPEPPAPATPAPQMVPAEVMQRRIAAMTKKQKDLERELELAKLGQEMTPRSAELTPEEVRRQAAVMAAQQSAQMRFEEKVNSVTAAGTAQDPQFLVKINQMAAMHGEIPVQFTQTLMDVADSDQEAAELLLDLVGDPTKTAQLFGMSPTKQAAMLTKMQAEKKKPAQAARPAAPAPIAPRVGAGGQAPAAQRGTDLYDPKTNINDWMAERDKQARAARRW